MASIPPTLFDLNRRRVKKSFKLAKVKGHISNPGFEYPDVLEQMVNAWGVYDIYGTGNPTIRLRDSSNNNERDFTERELVNGTYDDWITSASTTAKVVKLYAQSSQFHTENGAVSGASEADLLSTAVQTQPDFDPTDLTVKFDNAFTYFGFPTYTYMHTAFGSFGTIPNAIRKAYNTAEGANDIGSAPSSEFILSMKEHSTQNYNGSSGLRTDDRSSDYYPHENHLVMALVDGFTPAPTLLHQGKFLVSGAPSASTMQRLGLRATDNFSSGGAFNVGDTVKGNLTKISSEMRTYFAQHAGTRPGTSGVGFRLCVGEKDSFTEDLINSRDTNVDGSNIRSFEFDRFEIGSNNFKTSVMLCHNVKYIRDEGNKHLRELDTSKRTEINNYLQKLYSKYE